VGQAAARVLGGARVVLGGARLVAGELEVPGGGAEEVVGAQARCWRPSQRASLPCSSRRVRLSTVS
jgi:hypothetical protein